MTAALVSYMLKQGYKSEQIVVLTPYLGQLLEIHKELRKSKQQVSRLYSLTLKLSMVVQGGVSISKLNKLDRVGD